MKTVPDVLHELARKPKIHDKVALAFPPFTEDWSAVTSDDRNQPKAHVDTGQAVAEL